MARKYPPINQIFDDLDKLLEFCKECGFVYNPSDLYNIRTYVWQQYCKKQQGKRYRNNWEDQLARINDQTDRRTQSFKKAQETIRSRRTRT